MPSFRTRVLEALDIEKKHIRIPLYETFPCPDPDADQVWDETTSLTTVATMQPYAISKCIRSAAIGPKSKKDRIEVLGFVVGADPGSSATAQCLPDCIDRGAGKTYTGFHSLGGLYDETNVHLQSMRKSAPEPVDLQTMYAPGNYHTHTGHGGQTVDAQEDDAHDENIRLGTVQMHTHKDWPNKPDEQAMLLNDDPYADSLYYHHTSIRFFLTGLDDVGAGAENDKTMGDASANHRGSVRMLVLRPKNPKVSMRLDGQGAGFILNHDFVADWATELFYDRSKQVGGRLTAAEPHTTGNTSMVPLPHPSSGNEDSDAIITYGLTAHAKVDKDVETSTSSVNYGHMIPANGGDHKLNPFDILTSKVNKKKYAVLEDKVFTLDSLHHGAAAHHVANVSIPYYKKVRFAGRKPTSDGRFAFADDGEYLGLATFNEPLNLPSRPIVLFLSYNQRISAQVSGYTAISET